MTHTTSNIPTVGQICYSTFGYDANFTTFIKVVKVTPKGGQAVRLQCRTIGDVRYNNCQVLPAPEYSDAQVVNFKYDHERGCLKIKGDRYFQHDGSPISCCDMH